MRIMDWSSDVCSSDLILYFDFDRAEINQSAQVRIDNFVEDMKGRGLQNVAIVVEGHADRAGPHTYNDSLSERRAEEVRQAMQQQGIQVLDLEDMKTTREGETAHAVATPTRAPAQAKRPVEVCAGGQTGRGGERRGGEKDGT